MIFCSEVLITPSKLLSAREGFSFDSDYNDRFTPHHSVSQINVIVTDSIKTDLHYALDGFDIKAVIDDLTLGSLWM